MSNVCKQLACGLIRCYSVGRLTMVIPSFKSASPSPFTRGSSSMAKYRSIIREEEGDLFRASRQTSLAHCVSSDMKMGAGIAVYFRSKFGRVDDLLQQKKSVGEVAYLKDGSRYIFYLVTKKRFYDKPTEITLHHSLLEMRDKCKKLGVTRLAMPRIGCGLDGLKWPLVFQLIQEVFSDCGMDITVYSIPDRKHKTMTPTLSKARERFHNFFDTRKTHSLPASEMTSKRRYYTDSSEEDSETPKKKKRTKSNSDKSSIITGDEFDIQPSLKETSDASKNVRSPSLFCNFLGSAKYETYKSECQNAPLTHRSEGSLHIPHPQIADLPLSHLAQAKYIPFLCDKDDHQNKKIRDSHSDSESKSSPAPAPLSFDTPTVKKAKYSHTSKDSHILQEELPFSLQKVRNKPAASDSEDSIQDEPLRNSSGSTSKSSKRFSEAQSSNRSKTRLISDFIARSPSRENKKKMSSSSRSEEKVSKRKKLKPSDMFVRRSFDPSLSKKHRDTTESILSKRFPQIKEKFHPKDSRSSSGEDDTHSKRANDHNREDEQSSSTEAFSDDEDSRKFIIVKKKVKTEYIQRISQKDLLSRESPDVKKSLPDKLKGRLGRVLTTTMKKIDESVRKSATSTEYPSLNVCKDAGRLSKSPTGTMYSDREASRPSVKDRLSLGRK